MARPCVTYTEVANAIARLQAENRATTADNVRNLIGSGSKTTIVKHLRTWREAHTLEAQGDGLPLPLLEALKSLWTSVRNEANAEIAAHEDQTSKKMEALEDVLNRSQAQETSLNRENSKLQARLASNEVKIEEQTALLQAATTENVRLKEQNDGLGRQCDQQADEITRLHKIVKQMQDNLEHYQAENLKQKEAHSLERENERNAHMQAVRSLESQVSTLSERKAVLEHMLEHANKTLGDADHAILQLQASCKDLVDQLSENKTTIALLEEKNLSHMQQNTKHEKELKESSEKLCEALNQISSLTNKQELLETSLRKAEDRLQGLMDEKLFWVQEKTEIIGQLKLYQSSKE